MSGSWATVPTSCRDAADAGWADTPRSCRDGQLYVEEGYWDPEYVEAVFATWAAVPTSCRETAFADLDAGLGIDLECLADTGTVITAHGWTLSNGGSCRDG